MRPAQSIALAIATLWPVGAQTPGPRSGDPLVRVSVNLAQTDVVVTDSAGHPVRDLEAGDFRLFEDGKQQSITNFSWVDVVPTKAGSSSSKPLVETRDVAPARVPRREDLRRAIVLMVDDAGTNTADLAGILPAARRFVAEQIQPGDLAAVTASRGGMGIYEQLTGDKNQLYAAIDRIGHRPGWLSCDYIPPFVSDMNAKYFGYAPGGFIFSANVCQPADKNGYLRWAIEGLREVPGRKAIVLFSHSFGLSAANAALANSAEVVIYVLDPAGGEPSNVRLPGPMGAAGTATLASQTGGFRKLTAPREIGQDLGQVLEDMSGYYLLGYHPSRSDLDSQPHAVQRRIEVRVLRPHLTVRARATPAASVEEKPRQTREEFLQRALFSPFRSGNLRLRIQPAYTASAPNPKTKRRSADLRLHLTVENALRGAPDSLTVDTLVAVFQPDGTPVVSSDKRWRIEEITPKEAQVLRQSGLRFRMQVGLRDPGAYQVRAAVRDPVSGETGSAYVFLTIPDFNKGPVALATPVLAPSAWNEFAAGDTVQFSCELFGPAASRTRGEIRLFRDDEPAGAARAVAYHAQSDQGYLAGDLPLPENLPPGDYSIRLLTWSRSDGPSRPNAVYWSDITVSAAGNR